jgi:hypothetical protein
MGDGPVWRVVRLDSLLGIVIVLAIGVLLAVALKLADKKLASRATA